MSELTKENIDKIPIEDWRELIDLIPEIINTKKFGKVIDSSTEDESFSPFVSPNETVSKFLQIVSHNNMILVFDWMNWNEGQNILENGVGDYNTFDLMTLVKLITTIVRNDRFCEGYLDSKFEDGTVLKILNRLNVILN